MLRTIRIAPIVRILTAIALLGYSAPVIAQQNANVSNTASYMSGTFIADNGQKIEEVSMVGARERVNMGAHVSFDFSAMTSVGSENYSPLLSETERKPELTFGHATFGIRLFDDPFTPIVGVGYAMEKANVPYITQESAAEADEDGLVDDKQVLLRTSKRGPIGKLGIMYTPKQRRWLLSIVAMKSLKPKSEDHTHVAADVYAVAWTSWLIGLETHYYDAEPGLADEPGFSLATIGISLGFIIGQGRRY